MRVRTLVPLCICACSHAADSTYVPTPDSVFVPTSDPASVDEEPIESDASPQQSECPPLICSGEKYGHDSNSDGCDDMCTCPPYACASGTPFDSDRDGCYDGCV